MSRLHVMHVIEAMHQGGAESLILEHVRHAAPDVETTICALNRGGPALEAARALGARVELLAKGDGVSIAGVLRLASRMSALGVHVVNGHNPTGALYATAAAALAGVPAVVRTEHSVHYPGRHSRWYPTLERLMTARTHRVICVCEAVRRSHAPRFGAAAARFVTVANGISEPAAVRSRASTREALGVGADDRLALAVGSLTRQKAQHVAIEAFADVVRRVPSSWLLVAGEGPLRAALQDGIDRRGLGERVRLIGAREDVTELMAAADLFVLPSVREGLSVTLLEAMRAGVPAVVTDVGGNAEAVQHGRTGWVTPVGDVRGFADHMVRVLENRSAADAMGRAAAARWREAFTAERMVKETEAHYRRHG